jgi:hypothetical protein
MGQHFFPRSDVDFLAWGTKFLESARAQYASLGVSARDVARMSDQWESFRAAYTQHVDAHNAAAEAFVQKQFTRREFETLLRPLVRRIQANETTTDRARAGLGIAVPKRKRRNRSAVPQSFPLMRIDASVPLRHTVRFMDASTPEVRRKPPGVRAGQLWVAVVSAGTQAPLRPDDAAGKGVYKVASSPTRSPVRISFTAHQATKTAWYVMRWIAMDGSLGAWSAPVSATIAS